MSPFHIIATSIMVLIVAVVSTIVLRRIKRHDAERWESFLKHWEDDTKIRMMRKYVAGCNELLAIAKRENRLLEELTRIGSNRGKTASPK